MIKTSIKSCDQRNSCTASDDDFRIDMGAGSGAIVFLHGLFASPLHWLPVMADLTDRYRVIAPQLPLDRQPDRRQHGIKSIGELSDHVERFIDRLDVERLVLCGNSLGGLAAIEYCLRHPSRVEALVLAGSAGLYERGLTNGVRPKPTRAFVRATAADIIYNKALVTDEMVDEWHHALLDRDYVRFVLRVSRATRDRCVKDELGRLNLPTLMIWGRNDKITPPSVGEEFQSRVKHAELKFIDNCGHAPNLEQPEEFSQLLQEFLSRHFSDERGQAD